MNSATSCIFAAVIILIVLIIAVFIHCHYSKSGDKSAFMPGDAATPRLREAVALLSGVYSDEDAEDAASAAEFLRRLARENGGEGREVR